ncbi:hypothetical protein [Halococcus saccharolyticus]|uniref:Uncharacterized protein n=1 Tax=Halococcus saccharolyticus DSM 5350 TaxID=1227455 RepID=M0MQH7_9EURY|nr:hypothetical protein [Halococcus saccharolyticus]EMA47977.1 hypothetical protein C449_00855 [Halococcus saccharolyticus DSM 5350]
MPKITISTRTDEWNSYRFRATGKIDAEASQLNDHDEVDGTEIEGQVSSGKDTIVFDGVPLDFAADQPWQLDCRLNMGGGAERVVPPFLNAAEFEIKSQGCHYMLSVAEPGMILRGGGAEWNDNVLTQSNTLAAGNVKGGNADSYRIWPFTQVSVVADQPAKARFKGSERGWQDVEVFSPPMEF